MREEIDKNSRPARGHGRLVADPLELKLIKIGARVVRHARAISFQLAGVAVTSRLRAPPSCA